MRRHRDVLEKKHVFKGSVLVTFKTKEKAQAYLAQDAVKYQDTELIKMWQLVALIRLFYYVFIFQ